MASRSRSFRIEGAMANQVLKVTSATLSEAGGTVSASGSYDIKTRGFQVEAHGAGIDISRIGWVRRQNLDATGKLGFSLTGSGTLDDPRLEGRRDPQRIHPGRATIRRAGS